METEKKKMKYLPGPEIEYWGLYPRVKTNVYLDGKSLSITSVDYENNRLILNGRVSLRPSNVKPILRPLSDMTESEATVIVEKLRGILPDADCWDDEMILNEWDDRPFYTYLTTGGVNYSTPDLPRVIGEPDVWQFLLSQRFDLFNWIEQDLAIDATTLNPNPYREET